MNIPDHPYQCPDDMDKAFMSPDEYHAMHDGTLERLWEEGYAAAKDGASQCPYRDSAPDWVVEAWWEGYDAAEDK